MNRPGKRQLRAYGRRLRAIIGRLLRRYPALALSDGAFLRLPGDDFCLVVFVDYTTCGPPELALTYQPWPLEWGARIKYPVRGHPLDDPGAEDWLHRSFEAVYGERLQSR
jgi:hypothetical protein